MVFDDVERALDVGREHLQRDLVERLDHATSSSDDDHREAADAEPVAQRHRLAADAGQEVVGQELARLGRGLRGLALLLLVEDDRGQRRRVASRSGIAPRPPSTLPRCARHAALPGAKLPALRFRRDFESARLRRSAGVVTGRRTDARGSRFAWSCSRARSHWRAARARGAGRRRAEGRSRESTRTPYDVVVLVADVDGLRAPGLRPRRRSSPSSNLTKRWQGYFDAYGKVNGRTVNVIPVDLGPGRPRELRADLHQGDAGQQPVRGARTRNGYRQSSVGCITVDNDTFMFFGEAAYGDLQEASGKNCVSLACPPRRPPRTGVDIATEQDLFPKGAKIGILSATSPRSRRPGTPRRRSWRRPASTSCREGRDQRGRPGRRPASCATRRQPWPRCRPPASSTCWSSLGIARSTRRSSTRPTSRAPASSTCSSTRILDLHAVRRQPHAR